MRGGASVRGGGHAHGGAMSVIDAVYHVGMIQIQ